MLQYFNYCYEMLGWSCNQILFDVDDAAAAAAGTEFFVVVTCGVVLADDIEGTEDETFGNIVAGAFPVAEIWPLGVAFTFVRTCTFCCRTEVTFFLTTPTGV